MKKNKLTKADFKTTDSYIYAENSDGIEIYKYIGKERNVIVPARIKSKIVARIHAEAFAYNTDIESVELPNGITHIGIRTFYNCISLKRVCMGNNVEFIYRGIFENCISLEETNLSTKITSIPLNAFKNCFHLKAIELPGNIILVEQNAFENCIFLHDVNIPEKVIYVLANAFEGCYNLERVVACNRTVIDSTAFYGCSADLRILSKGKGIIK